MQQCTCLHANITSIDSEVGLNTTIMYSYQTYIPIKINNSRPKLLIFIFILLVTEKNNLRFFL